MQISNSLDGLAKYHSLEGKLDLRFELYEWLKGKKLSAEQAKDLLALTREAISNALRAESQKIML